MVAILDLLSLLLGEEDFTRPGLYIIQIRVLLFNLEYLLTCGDVQANPGPGCNSSGRPRSDNHQTSKNILRCMSLNARSICNKLNEFHDIVITKKVNVVAVTETWLHQGISDTGTGISDTGTDLNNNAAGVS